MIGAIEYNWSNIDFTGYDRSTDGSSGAVIATFRNPDNAVFEKGKATLQSNQADIIYVIGGTNDIKGLNLSDSYHRTIFERTLTDTRQHLLDASVLSPRSYFYVVSIGQIRGQEAKVDEYNARLKSVVESLEAEMKIKFIGVPTTEADMGSDGFHFTIAGGEKYGRGIANGSLDLIQQFGVCD